MVVLGRSNRERIYQRMYSICWQVSESSTSFPVFEVATSSCSTRLSEGKNRNVEISVLNDGLERLKNGVYVVLSESKANRPRQSSGQDPKIQGY